MVAAPNPATARIRFYFRLDAPAEMRVRVYSPAGERVAEISGRVNGPEGMLAWDCAAVGRGIYLVWVDKDGRPWERLKVALLP